MFRFLIFVVIDYPQAIFVFLNNKFVTNILSKNIKLLSNILENQYYESRNFEKNIFDQHQVIKDAVIIDRNNVLEKNINYILVGLRRAGKTTLLYKRVKELISEGVDWNQIIYINFDDERLLGFTVDDFDDILLVAEELTNKKHYFYFDEIQNILNHLILKEVINYENRIR